MWSGPTLLLAPAHQTMAEIMQRPQRPMKLPPRSHVIHSDGDTIVPLEHSEKLCKTTGATLEVVAGEPHKMWGISTRLANLVLELSK